MTKRIALAILISGALVGCAATGPSNTPAPSGFVATAPSQVTPLDAKYFNPVNPEIKSLFKDKSRELSKDIRPELIIQQVNASDIDNIDYSPDNSLIASSATNDIVKIWNSKTGRLLHNLRSDYEEKKMITTESLSFSPDGEYLATGESDGSIRIWDVKTGIMLQTIKLDFTHVFSVDYSPDGKTIAAGGESKHHAAKIVDPLTGKVIHDLKGHQDDIKSLSYSPNGKLMVTGSKDRTIKFWDAETGVLLKTIKGPESVQYIAFSKDNRMLAAGFYSSLLKVWNIQTGQVVLSKTTDESFIKIAFSSDNHDIYYKTNSQYVKVVSLIDKKSYYFTDRGYTTNFDISSDGNDMATGYIYGKISILNLKSMKRNITFKNSSEAVNAIAVSPDGEKIIAGCNDDTAKLWNLKNGKLIKQFSISFGNIYCVDFSPNGKEIVAGGANSHERPVIWNIETGREVLRLKGLDEIVRCIKYSPDGKKILAAYKGGTIRLFNADTGSIIHEFKGSADARACAFSPDGSMIAGSFDAGIVAIWNTRTGSQIHYTKQGYPYIVCADFLIC